MLACITTHLSSCFFSRLIPTFVFFHIFLLFLSCSLKLLLFSSQTILVPQGNKEADKWIVAKLHFQFLCWFFFRQNNYPGMVRRCQSPIWMQLPKQQTATTQLVRLSMISLVSMSKYILVLFDKL